MKSFLAWLNEDTRDKDNWRLGINGATGEPRFTYKVAIKTVYMNFSKNEHEQTFRAVAE